MKNQYYFTLLVTPCLWALLSGRPASAESNKAQDREAKKACLLGDYAKGASILANLYLDTNDATYLYNQARCYEQNTRYGDAIGRFSEYLRKATGLTPSEQADVEKHIADCQAALSQSAQPSKAAEKAPAEPSHPINATTVAEGTSTPIATSPVSGSNTRSWRSTAGWIAVGVSAGALGFGVFEYMQYQSKGKDFNKNSTCSNRLPNKGGEDCQQLAKDQDSARNWTLVGGAVAALGAGAALYWLSAATSTQELAKVGFRCAPTTQALGLACWGQY